MKSKFTKITVLLVIIAALVLTVSAVLAANPATAPAVNGQAETADYYIIQLSDAPLASYRGGVDGLAPTNPAAIGQRKLDPKSPASVAYLDYLDGVQQAFISDVEAMLGHDVDVNFTYAAAFNGMSIWLTPEEADIVAGLDGVVNVTRNFFEQLDTDVGPQWIGADEIWDGTATGSPYQGEGVTIGVLDTGLVLDHPSFAEVGPADGYLHTNPLGSGNFLGLCVSDPGNYICNDKTIGYWIFTGETHQDQDGHGSHTASTAGGNMVTATVDITPSNPFLYEPLISGVAPHANIIAYDVCTDDGSCPGNALVSGINQTVMDGVVDVINYSISGGANPWNGAVEQAFLAATDAGIVVAASAGNGGPGPSTLGHLEPWTISSGASTHNRIGGNALLNMAGGDTAPPADIAGAGLGAAYGPAPIVYAGDFGDPLCGTAFPAGTWTNGEIVVCDRGTHARVWKGYAVWRGGAGGYVLANAASNGNSINADPHYLPGIHITFDDGVDLKTWLSTGSGHTATIQGSIFDFSASNGDIMASFSSRGPNQNFDGLKPDVTGPGVDVVAAYTDIIGPPDPAVGATWMDDYNFVSGTSMSSPHTAGAAALLSGLYPSWSVPQIKSALMMGADPSGVLKEDGATPGDPFDYGNGSVRVNQAAQIGVVMDVTNAEFVAANPATGGDPKELNIPSMQDSACAGTCSWTRTLYNPTALDLNYTASVNLPGGSGTVTPSTFQIPTQQTQTITIEVDTTGLPLGAWAFGTVDLTEDQQQVAPSIMSIAVIPEEVQVQEPDIEVDPPALDEMLLPDMQSTLPLTISNVGAAALDWSIFEETSAPRQPYVDSLDAPLAGNTMTIGDLNFSASADGDGTVATPTRGNTPEGLVTITHSATQNIVAGNSVSCNAGGLHTDNSYLRFFTLSDFGITSNFDVVEVEVGIESATGATGTQPATVNLYIWDPADPFVFANFNLIGTVDTMVPDQSLSIITVPVVGTAPAGSTLVVEFFTPEGQTAGNSLFVGSNPDGQTGLTYLAAAACGLTEPLDTGSIGFPDMHLVMNVTGDVSVSCDPNDITWLTVNPLSGTVDPGNSDVLDVTFDSTGLTTGVYTGTLCIESNDPIDPLVRVPVQLEVNEPQPSIVMTKTVGTDPAVCATTDNIQVVEGATVYYCFAVENTGDVTLSLHDLVDDQLGILLDDFAFDLMPGASVDTVAAGLTLSATITTDTTNTGVWTAFNSDGTTASFTDTATVITRAPTDVSLSGFGSEANGLMLPLLAATLVVAFIAGMVIVRRREA